MSFTVVASKLDPDALLAKFNLESGGRVQQFIDKTVIDLSIPYCPFETGLLANSPYNATEIGSGLVVYPGPYARYLYFGEVYGPNIPIFDDDSGEPTGWFSPPGKKKHPTGRNLEYDQTINPLAGSHWVERMVADRKDDIVEGARKIAGAK